ncbi:MAG: YceI family protein [Bacteroidales bacterium]|nr:YceI family protein [Bacteroidales bacterium]
MKKHKHSCLIIILVFFATLFASSCKSPGNGNSSEEKTINEIVIDDSIKELPKIPNEAGKIEGEDFESDVIPGATIYEVDCEKSEIEWFCGKHTGYVKLKNGNLYLKDNRIAGGDFSILMDSIVNTDIDYELMRLTLMNILKSKDFFDIEKFPISRFTITRIEKIESDKYCISGLLKIKDMERLITFHSDIRKEGDSISAVSDKFIIDRTKWGITTMSKDYVESEESFVVSDEIRFVIHLVAKAQ